MTAVERGGAPSLTATLWVSMAEAGTEKSAAAGSMQRYFKFYCLIEVENIAFIDRNRLKLNLEQ